MAITTFVVNKKEPGRITLCGSTKFRDQFELWNKRLSLAGFLVYSVAGFGHSGDTFTDEEKKQLDLIHKAKIDHSHAIVVLTDENGYVGSSTMGEIVHAYNSDKRIYTNHIGNLHGRIPDQIQKRVMYVYGLRTGDSLLSAEDRKMQYNAFDWGKE